MEQTALSELISSLQAIKLEKEENDTTSLLPTPLQFYQLGLVLEHTAKTTEILHGYQEWLDQIPFSYLREQVFEDLNKAFIRVVAKKNKETAVTAAIDSLCGLYTNSSVACRAGYSLDLCTSVATFYDELPKDDTKRLKLLRILSALLLDGLLSSNQNSSGEEHLQDVMEAVKALTINEKSTCLGDLQEWQQQRPSLQEAIESRFDDSPQRDYLLTMLSSSPKASDATVSRAKPKPTAGAATVIPTKPDTSSRPVSELQRRIQSVRDVFPDLGEGYIETALALYHGDASQTVAALLDGDADPTSLHPTLQVLDKQLPARRRQDQPEALLQDEEAKEVNRARFAEMEQALEEQAYALDNVLTTNNEYDDDYDDQYDGMDGGDATGGADVGMYDFDLDAIKTYNRVAREAEQEDAFWEQNKNLNRQSGGTKQAGGGEGKYRGPDKGKGGRLIGPDGKYLPFQKSGKKGGNNTNNNNNNNQAAEKKSTKIQQRRKNNNKAKIANHHRKERAQKKAKEGM